MKRTFALSATATLLATSAIAGSHIDQASLGDAIRDELGAEYDLSQFEEIKVTIRRNEIEIEAEGEGIEVERLYTIADGTLGTLVEGEDEFERDGVEVYREFEDGVWVEEIDDDDDEDDDDDAKKQQEYKRE